VFRILHLLWDLAELFGGGGEGERGAGRGDLGSRLGGGFEEDQWGVAVVGVREEVVEIVEAAVGDELLQL
jgi:hypothetical protein